MFRTVIWFGYFWIRLIGLIPAYFKVNRLLAEGKIKERDIAVNAVVPKWAKDLVQLAGAKVTVIGEKNIPSDRTVLFVSNHQGNFDIPILLGYVNKPKAFIAKIELLKLPLIRSWMRQMNCVFLDRHDLRQSLRVMNEAAEYMKKGYSMVIFPEGTRSKGNKMGEFKAGSLRIATKGKIPIVPITIKGSYQLLEQNGNIIKPAAVEVVISELIETDDLTNEQIGNLHEKIYAVIASKL